MRDGDPCCVALFRYRETCGVLYVDRRSEVLLFGRFCATLNMDDDKKDDHDAKEQKDSSDPPMFYMENGFVVFTREFHLKRGYCCKSGCRHCPYGFQKEASKAN